MDKIEKTPAALAMDWSIQLEKSLRSRNSDNSIEALKQIGKQLEWWNCESEVKAAEYRMFGLIPGENKLFLNAIFLRLVDAFRFGSKQVKKVVVKIFLGMRKRRGRRYGGGILTSANLENYLESLRRVKGVFEEGDSEERASALVLFGCWANFAKDSPDVRYIVLSSLVSRDVLEVRAALFAAGCLAELSDDFALVFLEILTKVVMSSKMSRDVMLAAAHTFAKLCCSDFVADKAYKTGVKLLTDSSEDDFSTVMLASLSKIASRWMMLIPSQMELILLFLHEDRSLNTQVASLRCLRFILAREVCNFSSASDTVLQLFRILQISESLPTLQLEALKVLLKVLMFHVSNIPCVEMPELFLKLLTAVKNTEHSSMPARVLAIETLAILSVKGLGRQDLISGEIGSCLATQVISFVLDRVLLLVAPNAIFNQPGLALDHEVRRLLSILFSLAQMHSHLHNILLNNICLFIDKLMKMLVKVKGIEGSGLFNNEIPEYYSQSQLVFESKLMIYVSKVLFACLQNLEDTSVEIRQILDDLKVQIEKVRHCRHFDSYTTMTYSLLLRFWVTCIGMRHTARENIFLNGNSETGIDSTIQLDEFTLDSAKMMFEKNSYWSSYKAGKIAACQGAWPAASFIFERLTTLSTSASSSCWLKSLAQFSTSEKQIQYIFRGDQGYLTAPPESDLHKIGGVLSKMNCCNDLENLLKDFKILISADGLLPVSDMCSTFSFQRWFLTLRTKFLKTVVDIMKLLDNGSFLHDGYAPSKKHEWNILLPRNTSFRGLDYLINCSTELSYRMKKLTREFDLLLSSFMDMGTQSATVVSTLALSCSLIAFATGFALIIPHLISSSDDPIFRPGNTEENFHALLVEDLVGRLRPIDVETRENFLLLLKLVPNYKRCSMPRFQAQISSSCYDAQVLHKLCVKSVKEILSLKNDGSKVQVDGDAAKQTAGLLLLSNIISELIFIPFRTPDRFFRVRSFMSSELIVMNEDGKQVNGITIFLGFHLSLSLCLQVKNIPRNLFNSKRKVYCILSCEKYFPTTTEIGNCEGQEMVDIVDLNDKLVRHIVLGSPGQHHRGRTDSCSKLDAYICFLVNERGQGFSNCLLDVSGFPVGCYRIKWHTGIVDSRGSYWNLLPLNSGFLFNIQDMKYV